MYIHDQKPTEGIQHKLLVKLLGYDYKVEYKKGRENKQHVQRGCALRPNIKVLVA
jgi:hypothetical protein